MLWVLCKNKADAREQPRVRFSGLDGAMVQTPLRQEAHVDFQRKLLLKPRRMRAVMEHGGKGEVES